MADLPPLFRIVEERRGEDHVVGEFEHIEACAAAYGAFLIGGRRVRIQESFPTYRFGWKVGYEYRDVGEAKWPVGEE